MARKTTKKVAKLGSSAERLENLRKAFQANRGKMLSVEQVHRAVGTGYFRKSVQDLVEEGLPIEVYTDGRKIVGWELAGRSNSKRTSKAKSKAKSQQQAPAQQ